MPRKQRRARLLEAIGALEGWGRERSWAGPDPYEALNARRGGPLIRHPYGKRLLMQLVKRSPLNLRPLLGIDPQLSSMSAAHLLAAAVRLDRGAPLRAWALEALEGLRCSGYEEPCWGYHFDVQTRFFFYAAGSPNVIATSFAGQALLDLHESESPGSREAADGALRTALGACDFLLRHVPQTAAVDGAYFGYLPDDRTPIHNASLLVSALLARAGSISGRPELTEPAREGLRYALAHQRPDGSWPYAETQQGDWVDGFHTGYVLDALAVCAQGIPEQRDEALDAYWRGLRFYAERLFDEDGTPRYFVDETYPIDGQSAAQGIRSFAIAAGLAPEGPERDEWSERAWRVFDYAQRRLRRRDGAYVFQRRRHWVNRTPHVRWVQAPMLDALARLRELDRAEAAEARAAGGAAEA